MQEGLEDRGNGPMIIGTRVSVYLIYHYLVSGRSEAEMAEILRLTPGQVRAALQYIQAHEPEVRAVHEEIEARNARGNPPEIEAKLVQSRAKMKAWLDAHQRAKSQGGNGARDPGRCEH